MFSKKNLDKIIRQKGRQEKGPTTKGPTGPKGRQIQRDDNKMGRQEKGRTGKRADIIIIGAKLINYESKTPTN
jgi:hypothetical protein